jgi:hypothetical protein
MWRIFTSMCISESSGRRIPLALLFALGLTFVASTLFGSPLPCPTAPVTTYQATGFQCAIEGYTLEDFTFSDSETGGATLLPFSSITVNPNTFSTADSVSVQFFAPLGNPFSALSGQTAEYIAQYELDPVLPRITGQGIDLGPSDPATLTGQFCGNGTLVGPFAPGNPTTCSGSNEAGIFPLTLQTTGNDTIASALFPVTATTVDTRLVLDLTGPSSAAVFGTNADIIPTPSSVPEPSSLLWLAPGMFAMLWLRKKRLANGPTAAPKV